MTCKKKYKFESYEVANAYLNLIVHLRGSHWCKDHECWHLTRQVGMTDRQPETKLVASSQDRLIRTIAPQLRQLAA